MTRDKIKIVVFGARHTGQGPLGRAWGKTDADLPDLQPVVIYEREVEVDGKKRIVAAWILSLDPQFEYMRKSMFMEADAFIYTFDIMDITGKSLAYLEPHVGEVRAMYPHGIPEILVGAHPDPTITAKPDKTNALVRAWLAGHGNIPLFELDMTNKKKFFEDAEAIFARVLELLPSKKTERKP
ncbi:MAG: hypothetical protein GYA24_15435 [Candidatus Lokiarchaeota archaeon]|nr:hypothetical protein [Candidatus Lokiarchaeota archaeon]